MRGSRFKNPSISIIIPLHWGLKPENFPRFCQDLKNFLKQDYRNFEILLVVDRQVEIPIKSKRIRTLLTGSKKPTSPAEKRDFALSRLKSDVCAFIDDDAYPEVDWLKNAATWFKNPDIIAVGGPGITPPEDGTMQKIGGYIIESYLCSGGIQNRFYTDGTAAESFEVDWPAYNLFVRSDVLRKVGGYGSTFYGGEDTYLCIKLLKYGKILFSSQVLVFHHRRAFPIGHLKQISSVGKHRGYFFKKYPETSRSIFYTLPTILTLGFVFGVILVVLSPQLFLLPFLIVFLFFWGLGALSVLRHKIGLVESTIADWELC